MKSSITKIGRLGRSGFKRMMLAVAMGLPAIGAVNVAATDNGLNPSIHCLNPSVAPIDSRPYGKSYSKWAAAWWQWALKIPATNNPLLDTTGENADVGQKGPVWFLAGTFTNDPPIVRECAVPEGKALFFPIFNYVWIVTPGDPPSTTDQLRAIVQPPMDNAILSCEIDGQPVRHLQRYREDSVVFTTTLPDGNLFGIPAGDYAPSVDNGYYLFLNPLKTGLHTIHFKGEMADGSFSLDVTYILHVGKIPYVVPPDQRYLGKTYGQWSAKWWQWAFSLPTNKPGNPFIDDPIFQIAMGQPKDLWFLGAPVTLGTVERTSIVPCGKALFIAVLNVESSNRELDTPFYGATETAQREIAEYFADHIVDPFCVIDGEPVEDIDAYRVSSPQYRFTASDSNAFGLPGGRGTSVSDGYWIMLAPLSKGRHTIHFGGAFHFSTAEGDGFNLNLPLDMTYHLIVR